MISTLLLVLFCLCAAVSFYYAVCALYSKIKLNKSDSGKKLSLNRKYLIAVCILFTAVLLFFNFIFAVLSVITALYIKYVSDDKKKKERIKKINSQIAEAIKIFKNSVMTGQSLIQAVNEVSKQTNEPLSGEFKKVCDSVSLGISLDDALSQTSKNITSSQYKLFIDAIKI
jgi:tight adherence protein B